MKVLEKVPIQDNKFSLIANGIKYDDIWESIRIYRSMTTMAGTISVSTLDFYEEDPSLWGIKKGSEYIAYINDEVVSTGYLDHLEINYGGDYHSIAFTGRDKTCDLVDCPFVGTVNEWKNQTYLNIIKNLCKPFNILINVNSLVQSSLNTKKKSFVNDPGQSAMDQILTLCREIGVLPLSLGDGYLTLTKSSTEVGSDILSDTNILMARYIGDIIERYSGYIVKGEKQTPTLSFTEEQSYLEYIKQDKITNEQSDNVIQRFRPFVILTDIALTNSECQKRAKYEAVIRAGKSDTLEYSVEGWTQVKTGKIWNINKLHQINDNKVQIFESKLLETIENIYDSTNGFTTNLKFVHKNTYNSEALASLIKSGFDL